MGLQVLLGFMAADLGTGLLTAGVFHNSPHTKDGRLDSRCCFQGMCRKAEMLVFVGAANAADLLLDSHFLRSAVIIGFCASEALSLTENAGRMGIPLPAAWKNAISLLSRKAQPDSPSEQE